MAKKDKKAKGTTIDESTIADCTNAKIVMTLENAAKLETTPAGDYFIETPIGKVRLRKSETGRISWQLEGKQIARSPLYNQMKDAGKKEPDAAPPEEKGKKGKKGKKDKKSAKETVEGTTESEQGPAKAKLEATYKKKQLLNVLKTGQIFRKREIKEIEAKMTEKKVTGNVFVAILDDSLGGEVPMEKINKIFETL